MLVCLIGMGCEETEPEYEEPKHRTAHCFYEGLHFVMRRRVHSALTIGDSQSTGYARSHFNYNPIPYLFTSREMEEIMEQYWALCKYFENIVLTPAPFSGIRQFFYRCWSDPPGLRTWCSFCPDPWWPSLSVALVRILVQCRRVACTPWWIFGSRMMYGVWRGWFIRGSWFWWLKDP